MCCSGLNRERWSSRRCFFVFFAHECFVDDYFCLAEFYVAGFGMMVARMIWPRLPYSRRYAAAIAVSSALKYGIAGNAALLLQLVKSCVE
jgi:hypothetical protein